MQVWCLQELGKYPRQAEICTYIGSDFCGCKVADSSEVMHRKLKTACDILNGYSGQYQCTVIIKRNGEKVKTQNLVLITWSFSVSFGRLYRIFVQLECFPAPPSSPHFPLSDIGYLREYDFHRETFLFFFFFLMDPSSCV